MLGRLLLYIGPQNILLLQGFYPYCKDRHIYIEEIIRGEGNLKSAILDCRFE